ncbi:glucose-6-phosphate isomerase [Azospira restricta]|uniref:Glucose-6-phosphate isomerase n=1 Tax=Azospira restricta TaxID=404405 RepID=A0A974SRE2_9RHOO|nr:glucose-6-phosphate isomerase [Azospira restricta]QRJ65062.1 glucose-6-phosphate isomerase [Azospira restricta]
MTRSIADTPAWQALTRHAATLRPKHLRDLFAEDRERFARFSLETDGLLFDYSKQRIDAQTIALLADLATEADVRGWIARMFAGDAVNGSEGRAALHTALRSSAASLVTPAGEDVMPAVRDSRQRMRDFCDAVRSGRLRGYSGEPIRAVVNIGIGGSDLGPRMATAALAAFAHPALRIHYVSNLDAADLAPVLENLDPRSTLFIVASKTFTTLETLANAKSARDWLLTASGDAADAAMAQQFAAVTANAGEALRFGVAPGKLFEFRDWVGGRFSLWSPVGLPLALAIGMDGFEQMLAGAERMDRHFRDAPTERNLPLLMALLGIWNIDFLGAWNLSISPYTQSLRWLPEYLQQLDMESNGKSRRPDGTPVGVHTAPVVWGGAGSNTQHAYFQLLHQGGWLIPSDFIACAASDYPLAGHHEKLLANCLAQAEALAFGSDNGDPLRACPGNQPSSTLLLPRLTPFTLGQLVAAYEHKVCAQAAIWGINPFDQWGVELGKQLAARLLPAIESGAAVATDPSTAGLAAWLRRHRSPA